ncbi:MAG: phosphate ABC transporter permease PstA [Nitrososphaera sp.]|nr:phosphate ABC transporter permease PstA [Nitrososphaera sp.]
MTVSESRKELRERYLSKVSKASSRRRHLTDKVVTFVALGCVILALVPLGSILFEVVRNGISPILPTVTGFAAAIEGSQVGTSELSSAIGTGTFQYDSWTHELSYNIAFTTLSSPERGAYIYGPAVSGNEPRVLFTLPEGSPKIGSLALDELPGQGVAQRELFAGLWYVNINSNNFPDGELRGQILSTGGVSRYFNIEFFTDVPGSFVQGGGGLGPSIQGTLIVVALASIIAIPLGVLTGVYLSEFAGNGRFPTSVRLLNDVLTGMPSIVIGMLSFLTIVLTTGTFSAGAGAFALSIIMTPIVVRVTEESLKLIPNTVREAGHALGIPKWKVSMFIILKSAKSGVLTGIVIGVARIAGETAPLIMTILGARYFFENFSQPMDALPLRIFRYATSPFDSAQAAGWGGALILIFMVLILSVALRFIVERKSGQFRTRDL